MLLFVIFLESCIYTILMHPICRVLVSELCQLSKMNWEAPYPLYLYKSSLFPETFDSKNLPVKLWEPGYFFFFARVLSKYSVCFLLTPYRVLFKLGEILFCFNVWTVFHLNSPVSLRPIQF